MVFSIGVRSVSLTLHLRYDKKPDKQVIYARTYLYIIKLDKSNKTFFTLDNVYFVCLMLGLDR